MFKLKALKQKKNPPLGFLINKEAFQALLVFEIWALALDMDDRLDAFFGEFLD